MDKRKLRKLAERERDLDREITSLFHAEIKPRLDKCASVNELMIVWDQIFVACGISMPGLLQIYLSRRLQLLLNPVNELTIRGH